MDRGLQYLFGGAVSSALIAGAVAAFVSITALVASTSFPSGDALPVPGGPGSVRIDTADRTPGTSRAEPPAPVSPLSVAGSIAFQPSVSSPGAISHLAAVRRGLLSRATDAPGSARAGRDHRGSPGARASGRDGRSPSRGGPATPSRPKSEQPSSPRPRTSRPASSDVSPAASSGGRTTLAPATSSPTSSASPGVASKPDGAAPGLAKKPGGTQPGLAKRAGGVPPGLAKKGGTPPGLASKPGGLPRGQAKKG